MDNTDRERMKLALREAEAAEAEGEIPVGAALFRGDTLLWADHNRREQRHDPTAHAEMLCMQQGAALKGDWRLEDCTLYVTLEPCPMCAGAMVMSRLGRVVFGAGDPEKGCCGSVYDLPADPLLHSTTKWEQDPESGPYEERLSAFFRKGKRQAPGKRENNQAGV